jgi:IS30 family transposase
MSEEARAQLWAMWAAGKSFSEISRAIGYPPGSIFTVIKQTGGYVPAPRRRKLDALALAEREEISRGLARNESVRQIARTLGRPASTVSREITRNRGRRRYRAVDADDRAWRRARRPKACLLGRNPVLRAYVAARLGEDWSPEQIAGVLAKDAPIGTGVRVSHETIYKSLFVQSRGVLAKELQKHLRTGRPTRRNIRNTVTGQWRSQIKDAVSIRERPAEVEDRAIPGHWEGDLLLGRHWTQVATVVERATRFTVLVALDGRDMTTVTAGLSREMTRLPERLRKSLTWDRGMELADHRTVTVTTGLDVYFADPRSPWQRGTNENTNRLLRQYLPKGQSMAHLTQDDLDAIAAKLNTRPRKTLDFDTPADSARRTVALTG